MSARDPEAEAVDEVAQALLDAGRVLLGVTLRSVAGIPEPLTVPQHRLLIFISVQGPQRIGALARDLGVNQSNASRLVDRLVGQGLLARAADPGDARAALVSLTPAGERALAAVNELRMAELRAFVAQMPATGRRGLAAGLRRFSDTASRTRLA